MRIRRTTSSQLFVLGVLAIVLAGCTSGDTRDAKKTQAAKGPEVGGQLFVASAGEGRIEPQGGEHEWKLTLTKAHDSVGVFTDRPERKAGTESLAEFAAAWDKRGFAETPPNAAVVWGKDSTSRAFELSDPAYDSAADTLTFTAHDLGDEPSTALSSFTGTPDAELPTELGEVSLFIDNAPGEGESGGFFFANMPPGGTATITFNDQTLYSTSFNVVQGKGGGNQDSPSAVEMFCLQGSTQGCYVFAQLTLSPGTWPVTGKLDASSGVTVSRHVPSLNGAIKVPVGDFSYGKDN